MTAPGAPTRRAWLGAGGTALAAALAGCPFAFGGTNEEILLTLANEDDASHRLSVTVAFEGRTLLDRTVTLAGRASTSETVRNPDTGGSARVTAAVDGGRPLQRDVTVGPASGIRSITVEVTAPGAVSVFAGRT